MKEQEIKFNGQVIGEPARVYEVEEATAAEKRATENRDWVKRKKANHQHNKALYPGQVVRVRTESIKQMAARFNRTERG